MIDALFGSKSRVKLLHLFFNNPEKSFYVREITRIIDEQINSVRRELANMLKIGIIISEESDNKLFYKTDNKYKYFNELRSIFDDKVAYISNLNTEQLAAKTSKEPYYFSLLKKLPGVRLLIFSGSFVENPKSEVDILIVGDVNKSKLSSIISEIESSENREITYCYLPYEEFYYRLSVRDNFIINIIDGDRSVIIDKENLFK